MAGMLRPRLQFRRDVLMISAGTILAGLWSVFVQGNQPVFTAVCLSGVWITTIFILARQRARDP
jgi:hypothetical protein